MNPKNEIIEALVNYINSLKIEKKDIHVIDNEISVEIIGEVDPKDANNIIRIVLLFINDSRQIHIPILFIPMNLRYHGNGKAMIQLIYRIGIKHKYDIFVVDMVESFYNKLIERGAIPVDADSVQIIHTTDLEV